ncbi:hypothetical protein TFLX_04323 [Thermoflexales bacterium]|nr:hypothetical protein TFLX_04323 [Thermoflexales bacterium]
MKGMLTMYSNRNAILVCSILGYLISITLLANMVHFDSEVIAAAPATTLIVTNTNDSGPGSLRAAIVQASPEDTIVFAPSVRGTITLTTGQLVISKTLTITGPGAGNITISGNHATRIIHIGADANVNISGLAFADGYLVDQPGSAIDNDGELTLADSHVFSNTGRLEVCGDPVGGAIHNSGILTLTNTTINANTYADYYPIRPYYCGYPTGGVNNEGTAKLSNVRFYENGTAAGLWNGGTLVMTNGEIYSNPDGLKNGPTGVLTVTDSQIYENGAGVSNEGLLQIVNTRLHHNQAGIFNEHRLTLIDSQVDNNISTDPYYGSGVRNQGDLFISGTQIIKNIAVVQGGGITNYGTLTLVNSEVCSNTVEAYGGGIYNAGTLTLTNSLLHDNSPSGLANGYFVAIDHAQIYKNGEAGVLNGGTLTMTDSKVYDNHNAGLTNYGEASIHGTQFYDQSIGISGGSMSITDASIYNNSIGAWLSFVDPNDTIENTTISSNHGDGLRVWNGRNGPITMTLNNVTIANNTGKGVLVSSWSPTATNDIVVENSIVADNVGGNCNVALDSRGYNLDSGNSCALSATGDVTDTAPLLGPLIDDGSGTFTHALLLGSPALDRGNPNPPGSSNYACATTDQRGVSRPQNGRCDMGAFELVPSVAFRQAAYLTSKDIQAITLTVALNTMPTMTTTVSYATSDGTALAGRDYISTTGTLIFPPGTVEEVIALQILNDPANSTGRMFTTTLSDPSGFELGRPNTTFIIVAANVSRMYLPILWK